MDNGLKFPLPDLRTRLRSDVIDILALQETRLLNDEGRLAGYVGYHSKPHHPGGRSRASLYVRKSNCRTVVNLDMFSTNATKYAAVTIGIRSVDATVVSVYIRPTWIGLGPRRAHTSATVLRRHCVYVR